MKLTSKHPALYPLGSRRRWVETLFLLLAPFLIADTFIFLALHTQHRSWVAAGAEALSLIIPCSLFFLVQSMLSTQNSEHLPWLSSIIVNLAYGRAEEDGIYYREWFRWHFIAWKGIAHLEFWPESDARLALHLYSRQAPVVFVPDFSRDRHARQSSSHAPSTVDFISQKLNKTWTGKSPFLICFDSSQSQAEGMIAARLRKLSVRQRALANAFIASLFLLLIYLWVLARGVVLPHKPAL